MKHVIVSKTIIYQLLVPQDGLRTYIAVGHSQSLSMLCQIGCVTLRSTRQP